MVTYSYCTTMVTYSYRNFCRISLSYSGLKQGHLAYMFIASGEFVFATNATISINRCYASISTWYHRIIKPQIRCINCCLIPEIVFKCIVYYGRMSSKPSLINAIFW